MSNTKKIEPEVSSAADFKRKPDPIKLPSGLVMRLRNPGLIAMAQNGLIPNSLMALVQEGIKKGKEPEPEEVLGADGVDMAEMGQMVRTIVCSAAYEPKVLDVIDPETGEPWTKRDDDQVYVDDIDEMDQMFIFQWAIGGTSNLEQFRKESAAVLATVPGRKAVARKGK